MQVCIHYILSLLRHVKAPVLLSSMVLFAFSDLYGAEATWLRVEGFGSVSRQYTEKAGTTVAGGLRYTPVFEVADRLTAKAFLGPQWMPGTNKRKYVLLESGALAQFHNVPSFIFEFGGGGGYAFVGKRTLRGMVLAGAEYKLDEKLLGLIDRIVLSGQYVFNSGDLWVVTYGLSAVF